MHPERADRCLAAELHLSERHPGAENQATPRTKLHPQPTRQTRALAHPLTSPAPSQMPLGSLRIGQYVRMTERRRIVIVLVSLLLVVASLSLGVLGSQDRV